VVLRKEKITGEHLIERCVSENNLIEFGVYPVIYGMRINISIVGSMCIERSYCAGANQRWVEMVYSLVKNILENNPEELSTIDLFPTQQTKPMLNDMECLVKLYSLVTEPFELITLPSVADMRAEYFGEQPLF
jgi:hypothetical protein